MSWYRVPLWDLRPDSISYRNVAVWNLRSCIYGAPSLTRGHVCNLQCNHSMVRVAQNPKPCFTVSSESPPTWKARFPYLYPSGTRWPSYTPGRWVRLLRLAGLRWRYSNPPHLEGQVPCQIINHDRNFMYRPDSNIFMTRHRRRGLLSEWRRITSNHTVWKYVVVPFSLPSEAS
jgi:hypothetical protein